MLLKYASILVSPRPVGLPSRHRYLPIRRGSRFFLSFYHKISASLSSHVVLDSQRDIATSQYDVALAFSPFLPQITRFLVQPRRIGPPTRHRYPPIRRGSRFSSPFASKCPLSCRATSHWASNATWRTSNTTRRPLLHKKTTRAIRVVAYLLYLNSKVQSSLKLDSSKRCSGKRRGPHELEPMPACL